MSSFDFIFANFTYCAKVAPVMGSSRFLFQQKCICQHTRFYNVAYATSLVGETIDIHQHLFMLSVAVCKWKNLTGAIS